MSGNEFIDADFRVVRNIPLSDTSGELVFNSDFPYDNISARVVEPMAGSTLNVALEYDFEQFPARNLDQGITFFALVPDTSNIVEYANYDGITLTQYLLTTDNTQYPILITDDYLRWAVPPSTLNPYSIYKAYGSYRDKKNNQFIVFGEGGIGASGQQYSNFITSTNGLSWSNLRYNNPYLDIINSFSVDKTSDIGVAVGSGSTYSISILAGNTANGEIWLPIQGSRQLISNPKGVIRGSSWIVYGDPGASGLYSIVESQDGLIWSGVTGVTGADGDDGSIGPQGAQGLSGATDEVEVDDINASALQTTNMFITMVQGGSGARPLYGTTGPNPESATDSDTTLETTCTIHQVLTN